MPITSSIVEKNESTEPLGAEGDNILAWVNVSWEKWPECPCSEPAGGKSSIEFIEDKIDPHYGAYFLYVNKETTKSYYSVFTTLYILNQSRTKDMIIIQPPIDEQLEIINYIKKNEENIFNIIDKNMEQIENLKSYRQALISEAVTGKINLSNYNSQNKII